MLDNFIHVCNTFWLHLSPYRHLRHTSSSPVLPASTKSSFFSTFFCCYLVFFLFLFTLEFFLVTETPGLISLEAVLEEISFYSHWFWRAWWLFSGCRGKWPPESENIKQWMGKGTFICVPPVCDFLKWIFLAWSVFVVFHLLLVFLDNVEVFVSFFR